MENIKNSEKPKGLTKIAPIKMDLRPTRNALAEALSKAGIDFPESATLTQLRTLYQAVENSADDNKEGTMDESTEQNGASCSSVSESSKGTNANAHEDNDALDVEETNDNIEENAAAMVHQKAAVDKTKNSAAIFHEEAAANKTANSAAIFNDETAANQTVNTAAIFHKKIAANSSTSAASMMAEQDAAKIAEFLATIFSENAAANMSEHNTAEMTEQIAALMFKKAPAANFTIADANKARTASTMTESSAAILSDKANADKMIETTAKMFDNAITSSADEELKGLKVHLEMLKLQQQIQSLEAGLSQNNTEFARSYIRRIDLSELDAAIPLFSGDDHYDIIKWFIQFEDYVNMYGYAEKEKCVAVRRRLDGTAKIYVDNLGLLE